MSIVLVLALSVPIVSISMCFFLVVYFAFLVSCDATKKLLSIFHGFFYLHV